MIWRALWLLALIPPPENPSPIVSAIFPPGASIGSTETWTISGRNLGRADSIWVSEGEGLTFGAVRIAPSGRSASVEVRVAADAKPGFREVRVDGPDGISNLAIVRVDPLPQVVEVEPNDKVPAPSQIIRVGTAVAGTIRPLDVDRFRVEGEPGRQVSVDWETRRLGTSIIPVLTITGPGRSAIAQARMSPGGDRDCRTSVVIPAEGWFEVELRDNTYGGDDRARYRLRVDPAPRVPRDFTHPPRINELSEPIDQPPGQPWPVAVGPGGVTILGKIGQGGEVDRFRVEAKAGDRFRARVEASAVGSPLDSVLTVLGPRGESLGENDDRKPDASIVPPSTVDGSATTDSTLDLEIKEDGPITVELADRFGFGGPEFAYRLELGPPRDDFAVYLIAGLTSSDPAIDARVLANSDATDPSLFVPGRFGAFNLKPGTTTPFHFVVVPRGRPGSIEVRAEGLPAGVTSEPVVVRLANAPRSKGKAEIPFDAPPVLDSLRLRAADAGPIRGSFRVVARRRVPAGSNAEATQHEASAVVGVDAAGGPGRPVIRPLTTLPIRVVGPPRE